ncbi:DUF1800 domain-containing protein [Devosia sp. FJ2-5-3]|uniref:DUF1800 domain-containing protein n=1 Tax=Devosia sp. FJ2-5-3 TaxID=2976680 RepID=UPI0023D81218|nr:DUF1800 domain-containing protein [Devosia sp. FJ2-5-3]WEJ60168.1 DUF1800 domain-containing protein [Devosia sp. FJ2-5-3]
MSTGSITIENLSPISVADWTYERAAHLLERAGFGGTPAQIERLAQMSPQEAVASFVDYMHADNSHLPAFEESGFWEPSFKDFPVSRPAATELAERSGEAMGVRVKPSGDRPLQPVTNRFFYWLRATVLETRRLAFWWLDRMVRSNRPLEEKMTLFWHGHFATSEEKLRDYRKMQLQLDTLRKGATGNFGDLLIAVAKDPAMLVFLDAAQNVKGAPNENFGREVMELFTMGVGNYTEDDIREAARAFTGWGNDDLTFVVDPDKHDGGTKRFLGREGNFSGEDILRIILEQKQTATYIASALYRFFVRDQLSPDFAEQLGDLLRDNSYEIAPFLTAIFLSEDFYSEASVGTHIKSPTELLVSTYRKLGLSELPGIPDPHTVCKTLGQVLLYPPTVAGWGEGRSWITPGLLYERANFAREVMFPNIIEFRDPNHNPGGEVRRVNRNIIAGMEITAATLEDDAAPSSTAGIQETFNTRYASLMGYSEALRKLKPLPRAAAQFSLSDIVRDAGARTAAEAVDVLLGQLLRVPLAPPARQALVTTLTEQLGTADLSQAETYLEHPLRSVAHLIMSSPQFQLA